MPSEAYAKSVAEQRAHHAESKTFSGSLVIPRIPRIVELARAAGCSTGLDYGCGKGVQYDTPVSLAQGAHSLERGTLEELLRFKLTKFDPCVPAFDQEPRADARFDLVVVSHVLFWIPTEDLKAWVLPRLHQHARKLLVIVEKLVEPGGEKKRMVSDREAHPRFEHAVQWVDLLLPFGRRGLDVRLISEYRAADGRIYPGEWALEPQR
jgi:hypothetical protein